MQLRLDSGHTSGDYVSLQGWRSATLARCPLHPKGGCGFARHGTYARVDPPGTRIARWYCRQGHCTFSLLPDPQSIFEPRTLPAFGLAAWLASLPESAPVSSSREALEHVALLLREDLLATWEAWYQLAEFMRPHGAYFLHPALARPAEFASIPRRQESRH